MDSQRHETRSTGAITHWKAHHAQRNLETCQALGNTPIQTWLSGRRLADSHSFERQETHKVSNIKTSFKLILDENLSKTESNECTDNGRSRKCNDQGQCSRSWHLWASNQSEWHRKISTFYATVSHPAVYTCKITLSCTVTRVLLTGPRASSDSTRLTVTQSTCLGLVPTTLAMSNQAVATSSQTSRTVEMSNLSSPRCNSAARRPFTITGRVSFMWVQI